MGKCLGAKSVKCTRTKAYCTRYLCSPALNYTTLSMHGWGDREQRAQRDQPATATKRRHVAASKQCSMYIYSSACGVFSVRVRSNTTTTVVLL